MKKSFVKIFLSGSLLFLLISLVVISDDPCRKYAVSQPYPVDSTMFSSVAIVNSRTFNEEDLFALFQKIETDFPKIILTTQSFKNAQQAFDLTEKFNESLVTCNNYALGFYPKRFTNWLELIDANTSNLPDYSYLNYVASLEDLIIIEKSNYEDFDFHQMIVIVGDVGGGTLGKDYFYFDTFPLNLQ